MNKYILLLIYLLIIFGNVNARFDDSYEYDYEDRYENQYEGNEQQYYAEQDYQNNLDDEARTEEAKYYSTKSYNNTYYINGDICHIGSGIKSFIGCYLNGTCYERPIYGYCSNDNRNAWICDYGYKEFNGNCIFNIKSNTKCDIKGNISFDGLKRKIYHFPGCPNYNDTVINKDYGEKWFCTEKEAIEAGWYVALNCPMSSKHNSNLMEIRNPKYVEDPYLSNKKDNEDGIPIFYIIIFLIFCWGAYNVYLERDDVRMNP